VRTGVGDQESEISSQESRKTLPAIFSRNLLLNNLLVQSGPKDYYRFNPWSPLHQFGGQTMAQLLSSVLMAGLLIFVGVLIPSAPAWGDAPTPQPQPQPPGPRPVPFPPPVPSAPTVASFSPDGKWLVTANNRCTVMLWKMGSQEPIWTIRATKDFEKPLRRNGEECAAFGVAFAADGKRVFCAWAAGMAEIDRKDGTLLRTIKFPVWVGSGYISHTPNPLVAFLPGSDECVFNGTDKRLIRFDFKTEKIHEKFNIHLPNLGLLYPVVSSDGKRILTYVDYYLAEWDLNSGEQLRLFDEFRNGYQNVSYSPDGERIWVTNQGSAREQVLLLDRKAGKRIELPVELSKHEGWIWPSTDGKHAIGLTFDLREKERVDIIRLSDGKILRSFSTYGLWFHPYRPEYEKSNLLYPRAGLVTFTPDGKTVMLVGTPFNVAITHAEFGFFDMETGKNIRIIGYDP
jgi:hypothetical protein